eukprot:TRINITY_DN3124_c0_g1_i1.p1 TRINITY_DN3124_c0_g1~~TRINITY_DN3124_c0_g1_i1.p1  ORF type:complete len:422 (+),score=23.14 TRINITY_DN3124_c0_g1_i1:127-1392(+)
MKLFVGQIPVSCTENELRRLFSAFGRVLSVTILHRGCQGRPRTCGFVAFASPEDGCAAIASLHDQFQFPGATTRLQVRPADTRKGRNSSSRAEADVRPFKLFVGRLGRQVTEQYLVRMFSPYGEVVEAVIFRDGHTGMSQRAGFIRFNNFEACELAISALHHRHVAPGMSAPLEVRYAFRPHSAAAVYQANEASVSKEKDGCQQVGAASWASSVTGPPVHDHIAAVDPRSAVAASAAATNNQSAPLLELVRLLSTSYASTPSLGVAVKEPLGAEDAQSRVTHSVDGSVVEAVRPSSERSPYISTVTARGADSVGTASGHTDFSSLGVVVTPHGTEASLDSGFSMPAPDSGASRVPDVLPPPSWTSRVLPQPVQEGQQQVGSSAASINSVSTTSADLSSADRTAVLSQFLAAVLMSARTTSE